jgi:hypothetical protein
MEEQMPDWFEKHFERGRQQGLAEARAEMGVKYLLLALAGRGIPVDDQTRQRIMSCTDVATLNQWLERAVNATSLSEVLSDLTQ